MNTFYTKNINFKILDIKYKIFKDIYGNQNLSSFNILIHIYIQFCLYYTFQYTNIL